MTGWLARGGTAFARVRERAEDAGLALQAAARLAQEWCGSRQVYNPLARASRADPYAAYRRLRERDPVHRSPLLGGWILFAHRDVAGALRDARLSSDDRLFFRHARLRARMLRRGALDPDARPSMLRLDPPDHTRLRALVQRAFAPRAIALLEARVQEHAERLLDAQRGRTELELISALAHPLPVIVIAELLGVSPQDRPHFRRWSSALAGSLGRPHVEAVRGATLAARELRAYFARAQEREREPGADLIALLQAAERAGELSREELMSMLILLLVAGNETTTHWIGNAVLALLQHPGELEALRAEPARLEAVLDEVLRYESPVQATARVAREELQIGGRRVRPGEQLLLLLGSANRDPEPFPDPDRFDSGRSARGHLAFGLGRHGCLGGALARLEARAALGALLRRYPRLELAPRPLRWQPSAVLRGLRELHLLAGYGASA